MSILDRIASGNMVVESVEPEYVSESDMATLMAIALEEVCNEEELEELKESMEAGTILTPVEERSIVKLDNKAKKQQAYKAALYMVAKENKDANYEKLVTLWKAERELEARIEKRWHSKATSRMKQLVKEASKSKSDTVKKISNKGDRLTRSQKMTQKALKGVPKDAKNNAKANSIVKKLKLS